MNYTYRLPDTEKLRRALIAMVESCPSDWSDGSFMVLNHGKLELDATKEPFDEDGHLRLDVTIRTAIKTYELFSDIIELDNIAGEIIHWTNEVLPRDCGYKVKYVDIVPNVEDDKKDSKDIIVDSIESEKLNILAADLLENGRRMSQAYVILYCLENLLREFIDKTLVTAVGTDYEVASKGVISSKLRGNTQKRKDEEAKRKWLPLRGNKLIFYFDFIDLSDLIERNWSVFETSFPSLSWIKGKLEELYNIRCIIAHNGTRLDDDNFDLLNADYKQIVKQIGK